MVSVFVLTYNQQDYIEKTLLSILSQKTEYTFQIVIGDDCSVDGTQKIIRLYAKKYPGIIKPIYRSENIGLINNYIETYKACDGKYISICDGDDYWIDDHRLQRQASFLESKPEFSIIYGRNYNLSKDKSLTEGRSNLKSILNFNDLIIANFIPSVTVMFRKIEMHKEMINWISQFPYGDWPTYLLVCNNGSKIYHEDKFVAVYRRYGGVSTALRKDYLNLETINYNIVNCIYKDKKFEKNKSVIKKSLFKHKLAIAIGYFKQGSFATSFKWAIDPFSKKPLRVLKLYLYLLKNGSYTKG